MTRRRIPFTDAQRREIVKLYQLEGYGLHTLARRFGCSYSPIQRVLDEEGISHHPIGGPQRYIRAGVRGEYRGVWIKPDDPLFVMAQGGNQGGGYVLEHRLVMGRSLGRPLTADETVHHINGDKTDNCLANLQLRSGRHGKGVVHECSDCGSRNIKPVRLKP